MEHNSLLDKTRASNTIIYPDEKAASEGRMEAHPFRYFILVVIKDVNIYFFIEIENLSPTPTNVLSKRTAQPSRAIRT